MTETEMKLRDAATQMKIIIGGGKDDDTIRSCVNAYIAHARSVTFVMKKESSQHPDLEKWYEEKSEHLKQDPLMRFFNEKRRYTIHKGVITPQKSTYPITKIVVSGVSMPGTGTMTIYRFDGVDKYIPGHNGNMYVLCEQYFIKLKMLVRDWLIKRKELGLI
jgi:hypothetical protein